MATLKSENFDGSTAPALPASWIKGADVISTTAGFVSSPNGVTLNLGSADQIAYVSMWPDSNAGNHEVSATCWATAASGAANAQLLARMTAISGTSIAGVTCYAAKIDFIFGTHGVSLLKYIAGSPTVLT